MSIFIQEVLNLLQRKQDKKKLQLKRDWFEFGRTKSSYLGKSSYAPKMDHYTIRFDDLKCEIISGLVGGTGTEHTLPVWSTIDINNCKVQTIVDSIFSQDDIATEGLVSGDFRVTGNTVLEQNLQVDQNANINSQLTAGSANIKDLTEDRIVIVGLDGELEDDANFTFDGTTFNIGQGNFTVDVTTGNTQIIGTLNVDDQATFASANVEDLTEDRLVIAGPDGELEDSPNLTFDGEELTTSSLTVTDLTEDRVVIVGSGGQLEDDANFTFDGVELNIGAGNFTVQVSDGNTQILGTLDVDGQSTLASVNVEDLTDNRVVIVGVDGELEDDANFTFDGSVLLVNGPSSHLHGDIELGKTPSDSIYVNGAIVDAAGNTGQENQVLIGQADGTVLWGNDDVVEELTHGSLWQGDSNNLKQELAIGTVNQILISDGTTFSWQDDPYVGGSGTLHRLPLWTPDGDSLGDSILIQDGDSSTPATQVTVEGKAIVEGDLHVETNTLLEGNVEVNGTTKLDTLAQDDTLVQVLVRDTANDNLIKFRDASSIKPQVGFDTLAMTPDGWASADGNFNAFVNLDDTTTAVKSIKDMTWLVDGDRVVVIAENVKTGSALADNAIQFPDWVNDGVTTNNFSSWDAGINSGYPTSTLLFGEKLKFRAELYQQSATINQLNWDACCKITANNSCPVATSDSYTIDEDSGTLTATAQVIDDGYGSYGLTYTALTQPGNGTFTFDTATGAWTYTPNANYHGVEQFTFQANDGYCDSNIATITINISAVNDKPLWTSTNPVTANTYPNLTGGDQWEYNWTAIDAETPCSDLTYTVTVTDETTNTVYTLPDANQWLTFTPTPSNRCGGTLSGQYPPTGGAWTVNMTVSDDGNPVLSETDSFTIAGILPTINTYFVNWFDASGSMDGAGTILSRASSIGYVRTINTVPANNSTTVIISPGSQDGGPSGEGQFVNDMSDITSNYVPYNNQYLIVDGMELFVMDQVTGNETSTGAFVTGQPVSTKSNTSITLTNPVTLPVNSALVFRRTAAQKKADYDGGRANNTRLTARSFLQDFYAIGLTEAQEDAANIPNNPATNGSDEYDNKVKFGWRGGGTSEHTIKFLANCGNGPLTTNPGDQFENADTVVIAAWGDESNTNYMTSLDYQSPNTTTSSQLVASDIAALQSYIQAAETAAGNNQIYRAVHMVIGNATPNIADLVQGLVVGVNGPAPTFGGGWTNNNLMPVPNNTSPIKYVAAGYTNDPIHGVITGVGNQNDLFFASLNQTGTALEVQQNGQYYMGIYRERLLALGFVGI